MASVSFLKPHPSSNVTAPYADDQGAIHDRSRYTRSDAGGHNEHVPVHACTDLGIRSSRNGYGHPAEARGTEHNRKLASSELIPFVARLDRPY